MKKKNINKSKKNNKEDKQYKLIQERLDEFERKTDKGQKHVMHKIVLTQILKEALDYFFDP